MSSLGLVEAFRRNRATLKNPQWSVCAMAEDGVLVVSLWEHHFDPPKDGSITCRDRFSRWSGAGNNEFREKVHAAFDAGTPVRVVIAHTEHVAEIQAGDDASRYKKTFSLKEDWVGEVTSIVGDDYEFTFRRI